MEKVRDVIRRELNTKLTNICREAESAIGCLNDGELIQALARIDAIKDLCAFDSMLYQFAEICDQDSNKEE